MVMSLLEYDVIISIGRLISIETDKDIIALIPFIHTKGINAIIKGWVFECISTQIAIWLFFSKPIGAVSGLFFNGLVSPWTSATDLKPNLSLGMFLSCMIGILIQKGPLQIIARTSISQLIKKVWLWSSMPNFTPVGQTLLHTRAHTFSFFYKFSRYTQIEGTFFVPYIILVQVCAHVQ